MGHVNNITNEQVGPIGCSSAGHDQPFSNRGITWHCQEMRQRFAATGRRTGIRPAVSAA